jgi:hypothetical protein
MGPNGFTAIVFASLFGIMVVYTLVTPNKIVWD